jgi:23S rRNA (uracil747-C5)-methyltransferase
MGMPRVRQLSGKETAARAAVGPDARWLPTFAGREDSFRNKAKMVVGGTLEAPTLGILDAESRGVDLADCGITSVGLRAAFPAIRAFITQAGLTPYDVAARRGELKHVLITEAPDGALMARFVLRSTEAMPRLRKHLPGLRAALPHLRVATANILPAHVALLEGDEEHVLTEDDALTLGIGDLGLSLPPRSFFQTNTEVAAALYVQAQAWVAPIANSADRRYAIWDLYCGVGGFALHLAGPGRVVTGVETSEPAIASARAAGVPGTTFLADDATRWAREQPGPPDLIVVNPPRRGIGPELADWLEASGVPTVVYSSCNPVTLATDLQRMPSLRPVEARVFDMFPQTEHLEVMVLLERR